MMLCNACCAMYITYQMTLLFPNSPYIFMQVSDHMNSVDLLTEQLKCGHDRVRHLSSSTVL